MLDYLDIGAIRVHDVAFTSRSLKGVQGLTGIPGVRGQAFDRAEEDGGVEPEDQYLPARMVVLEGEVWAATRELAWTQWDILAEAFESIMRTADLVKWRRAGGSRDVQFTGRLAGDVLPKLDEDEDGPFIRWQAIIRAADPRHYSQTLQASTAGSPTVDGGMPLPIIFPIPFGSGSSGGSLTLVNAGRTKTWPTITIDGPIVAPVVEHVGLGRALRFEGLTLAAGQQLVIQTAPSAPRSARIGGTSALGSLDFSVSRWFWLEKGSNVVRFYGLGGGYGAGTTMTISFRDAWLS